MSRTMERAKIKAIKSIANLLKVEGSQKLKFEGFDADCCDTRISEVYLSGKCVRVKHKVDYMGEVHDDPINVLSVATVLMIWEIISQ